jgi:hypothetical protein
MMQALLSRLAAGQDLTAPQASSAMELIAT